MLPRMSYRISSPHRLAWPPRLLMLCAWVALVWFNISLPAQAMSCCPSGMAVEMMSAVQMTGAGHQNMASMVGKHSRSGNASMSLGAHPGHDGLAAHTGCPLCAGTVFIDSRFSQLPDRGDTGETLWTDRAVGRAPEGDWRRRLRPPSLV